MCHSQLSVRVAAIFCACLVWAWSGPALGQAADEPAQNGETGAEERSAGETSDAQESRGAQEESEATPLPDDHPASGSEAADMEKDQGPEPAETVGENSGVRVSNYDTVTLNVQNTDLTRVLQLLSMQSKRNIVPSPKVAGTVTANLYDVTFHQALDAVLQQNGAGYIEKGDFIFVYTMEELKKIRENQRELDQRVFRLDYITAQDAQKFIEPLMSSAQDASIAMSGEVGSGFKPDTSDGGANSYANVELLVVHDYPSNLDEIEKVLDKIDTRPKQVLIEATILRATLTDELGFGVNLSILGDVGLDDVANPLGPVSDIISGNVPDSPSGGADTSVGDVVERSGMQVGVLTHNVAAFVQALDSITDTTVMANPKVMTLNRQRAEVLVGEKVAYLSTTATSTSTTQTVEFLDTGTQLTVRPFVSDDGMIRMELAPQISTATRQQVSTGSGGQVVTLPDEQTQELTTNVMVNDGQTVVLGGLFKEETEINREQVPGLGDIPVLGNAFKGRNDSSNREEVIFLITPHIVEEQPLAKAGEAAKESIQHRVLGARDGLLPWSRTKLSASHMRQALDHLETGNLQKALWEVDLALGLDPTMAEARRLKERLTGQRVYSPQRSLLNETVNLMIEEKTGQRPESRYPTKPDPAPSRMRPLGDDSGAGTQQDNSSDGDKQSSNAEMDGAEASRDADSEEGSNEADRAEGDSSGEDGEDNEAQVRTPGEPSMPEVRRAMDRASPPGTSNEGGAARSGGDSEASQEQSARDSGDSDASEQSSDGMDGSNESSADQSGEDSESTSASGSGSDGSAEPAVQEYLNRVRAESSDTERESAGSESSE